MANNKFVIKHGFISKGDSSVNNSFSASTIYSGSTDLSDIFLTTADGNDITRVQPGTNINTGGTANNPVVNLDGNISLTSVSANTLSGGTIYSGSTNLSDIFVESILVNETVYVDALNGSDSAGVRGDMSSPYLTISGANQTAVTGDTVHVRPGTYQECDILTDGVSYYFDKGSIVHPTDAQQTAADKAILDANAYTYPVVVLGYGEFISDVSVAAWTPGGACIAIVNDSALLQFYQCKFTNGHASGVAKGTVYLRHTGDNTTSIEVQGDVLKDNSTGGSGQRALYIQTGNNYIFKGSVIHTGTGTGCIGVHILGGATMNVWGEGSIYVAATTTTCYGFYATSNYHNTLWDGTIEIGTQANGYAYYLDTANEGTARFNGILYGAVYLSNKGGTENKGAHLSGSQECGASPNGYAVTCNDTSVNIINLNISTGIKVFNISNGVILFQGSMGPTHNDVKFIDCSGGKFIFNGTVNDSGLDLEESDITGGEVIIQSDFESWGGTSSANQCIFNVNGGTLMVNACKVENHQMHATGSGIIKLGASAGTNLILNSAELIGESTSASAYSVETPTAGVADVVIYGDSYTNRPVGPGTINNTVPNGGFLYDLTGCTTVRKYCDWNISGNTTTLGLSANTLSGGTIYSGSTDLYDIFSTGGGGGSGDITRVQPGTNINTGGTANNPIVNLDDDIVLNSVSATTLSGGTIYSGSTNLSDIFTSGSGTDNTIPLWNGASSLDDSIITQQLATGATISGELKVSDNIGIGTTTPDEKLHIFGSGTTRAHIQSSGLFSYLKVENSSKSFGVGISNSLFGVWDYDVSQFRMVINSNGEIGIGTISPQELLHVDGSIRMVDGSEGDGKIAVSDTGGTISFSGASDLGLGTRVQPGTNINTGGTVNNPVVNLDGNISLTSVSANTLSGGTIYSGSTDLSDIFLTTADGNDITRVQPGTNINTGGTANNPIVNLDDDISLNSASANTLSGGTIYSGSTDLSDIFIESIDTGNVLWVDNVFGNDGTALVDRQDKPWVSIATAIGNATTNDTIMVRPGEYVEPDFTLVPSTSLVSQGGAKVTFISASTSTGNFITVSGSSYMEGFTIYTPTDDSAALYFNDSTAGIVTSFHNVHFKGSSTTPGPLGKGIVMDTSLASNGKIIYSELRYGGGNLDRLVEVNKGIFALDGMHVPGGGTITTGIQGNGGRLQLINVNIGNPLCGIALSVSGTSSNKPTVAGFGFNIFNVPIGIEITSNDYDVEVQQGRLDAGTTNLLITSGLTGSNGKLNLTSFSMDSTKLSVPYTWVNSPHTFQFSDIGNSQNIEPILRSWSNFEVGHANKGFNTSLGRGSEYQNGMHVHTSGTSATTDVSVSAKTEGTTWTFESLTAGEQIYIGSSQQYPNGDYLNFNAFNVEYTGSTGGTYTIEFYSGSTWVDVGYQCVHHELGYNYGNTLFGRNVASDEVIRFGMDEEYTWDSTSIAGFGGHTAKWIRITMVTPPASLPQFGLVWLDPSHTEINKNGIVNFYGNSLYRDTLVSAGNIFGLDGAVTDASISVGSTVTWSHIMENSQFNASGMMGTDPGDAIMLQSVLPKGTCTAYPLRIIIHYILTGSGPLTTLPEITLSVVGKESYNNFNADPTGGLIPTRRTLSNTNDLTTGGAENNILLGELADFSSEFLSVTDEYDFDISSLYESDGIFIRIEFFYEGVPTQTITFPAIEVSVVKWALGERTRIE